mmetsp:Transcript_28701/g.71600  ORF Transcript_28701/g.71600 Transcript_28701/m.71600 type:complete len:233 (+) Transcript_28701:64-762(+)
MPTWSPQQWVVSSDNRSHLPVSNTSGVTHSSTRSDNCRDANMTRKPKRNLFSPGTASLACVILPVDKPVSHLASTFTPPLVPSYSGPLPKHGDGGTSGSAEEAPAPELKKDHSSDRCGVVGGGDAASDGNGKRAVICEALPLLSGVPGMSESVDGEGWQSPTVAGRVVLIAWLRVGSKVSNWAFRCATSTDGTLFLAASTNTVMSASALNSTTGFLSDRRKFTSHTRTRNRP